MPAELEAALAARGAVLALFEALTLPAHFGDPAREWRAAREGAAVIAATYRQLIAATGGDRIDFLQGMLSNDVKALVDGQGVYAAVLDQTGKVATDLRVYAEPQRLLLDVVAWRAALLRERLEKYLVADDVELEPLVDEIPLVQLEGPLAAAVAREALGLDALPVEPLAHARASFQGAAVRVVRASEVWRQGVLLCGPPARLGGLLDACCEAGGTLAGMQALDALRIEAGVAWPGRDMDDSTLIMETGREAAVSFNKGCYLGQEVVERIAARGHVNRRLSGLQLDADALPAPRTPVLADGREVGYVTSATHSPLLGRGIALAYIHRRHWAPGERLRVGDADATVVALPFDRAPIEEDSEA
ncbi:MAG: glycine cleavage T C-terminal barrel domain-containing protein [Deltaproteobacteria bacterium]|nr:glycine cleavage T C-terminal barrel domain-containing protein [Deltaproteobacteria bacterium]